MLNALILVAATVAAPLAAAEAPVTISCRGLDGTLAPCERKLTGGSLGYHETISSAGPSSPTGPSSYAPVASTPAPIWAGGWGGGWGGFNQGHRGGHGEHRAAPPAPPAPRPQTPAPPAPIGGGQTFSGITNGARMR